MGGLFPTVDIDSGPQRVSLAAAQARELPGMPTSFQRELDEAMKRGYVAAFRWLRSREGARDACQEAAARALAARGRYDSSRPFYPWFYRILKNLCLDWLSGARRAEEAAAELEGRRDVNETRSPEHLLLRTERERAVITAIGRLPVDLREIIELRHFQDSSYEEMAEVLGCPIGTVMSRLYRARKRLRQILLEDADLAREFTGGRRTS